MSIRFRKRASFRRGVFDFFCIGARTFRAFLKVQRVFCGMYKGIRRSYQPIRNEEIVRVRFLFGLVQIAKRHCYINISQS